MKREAFRGGLDRKLQAEDIRLDETALSRLERFAELLEEWNGIHNLTGARNREEIEANIVDSLIPAGFVEAPERLLDVGTGAGFPGLILATVWPQTETVLCEPLNKRAAFLRLAALELGLERLEVAKTRVEALRRPPFGLISSRAVTDTKLLLDLTRHLATGETRWLLYKGSRLDGELEAVEEEIVDEIVHRPPRRYLVLKRRAERGYHNDGKSKRAEEV